MQVSAFESRSSLTYDPSLILTLGHLYLHTITLCPFSRVEHNLRPLLISLFFDYIMIHV